jgi:hypothetical protein
LPADHTGASWMALRPGEVSQGRDTTTAPDLSQDLTEESRPLDAFDGSYEELIQDLAEAADWGEGIYANDAGLQAPNGFSSAGPSDAPTFANGTAFGPAVTPAAAAGDEPDGEDELNPFVRTDQTRETEDAGPLSDALSLIPLDDAEATVFEGPLTGLNTSDLPPSSLPSDQPESPILLDASVGSPEPMVMDDAEPGHPLSDAEQASHGPEAEPGAAERQGRQGQELNSAPKPSADASANAPLHSLADDDAASTAETVFQNKDHGSRGKAHPSGTAADHMLSTERQALRQTHHQEEVIKTIQSALNRRTHYSLRRKLLEIYGKRCVMTDSNILPLLETVLIDGSNSAVADHPSNGLVLRKDVKILYNLYLIAINPSDYTVMLAPSLRRSSYGYLEGRKINLPKQTIYHPNRQFLQAHLDQCKWLDYGVDVATDVEGLAGAAGFTEAEPDDRGGLISKIALGVGGLVVGSLLTSLLWTQMPLQSIANRPTADSVNPDQMNQDEHPAIPVGMVDPENRVGLQLGPLLYPMGGVIYDESAYLSVVHLQGAGVISGLDGADVIKTEDGQRFVKAAYVSDAGLEVSWDAETRQVSLDCCSDPEIEPINVAAAGQNIAEPGLIIEGSAFAPVEALERLTIAPVQVPYEYFVGVEQSFYIKSTGLKAIGIDVSWNADTRTLTLER